MFHSIHLLDDFCYHQPFINVFAIQYTKGATSYNKKQKARGAHRRGVITVGAILSECAGNGERRGAQCTGGGGGGGGGNIAGPSARSRRGGAVRWGMRKGVTWCGPIGSAARPRHQSRGTSGWGYMRGVLVGGWAIVRR